jgi:RNA polymerase sigma-70 factor (ECF subfamily)
MELEKEPNLIQQSLQGNSRAFRELVEAHQGLAYSIAFRFTRDEQESEDIVQEAFIKIWKNLSTYRAEYKFKTWLAKIVTNLCLDYLKSGRIKKRSEQKKLPEPSHRAEENKLEEDELRAAVMALADQLTEKQKAVFILRDLEMMEPHEVCEILQMSSGNLKSNLYYARLKIKEGLKNIYKIGYELPGL